MYLKRVLILITLLFIIEAAYAAAPVIHSVSHHPYLTQQYTNVTIQANVTDVDGDLSGVYVNITTPSGAKDTQQMFNLSLADIFESSYNGTERGTYDYIIRATDLLGNVIYSNTSWFFVVWFANDTDIATINVEVKATCCGLISYFYVPDPVIQNQTVAFILFFQNCGNIPLTDKTIYVNVTDSVGTVLASYGGEGIPAGGVDVGEEAFFFTFWSSRGHPLGNYTARGFAEYSATLSSLTDITYNFSELNSTTSCSEIVDNRTNCTKMETKSCYDVTDPAVITAATTINTSANVSGMNNGTDVYLGNVSLNGTTYGAYTFNMTSCGRYCYACVSTDAELNSSECAYEGSTISSVSHQVYQMQSDGQEVSFREVFRQCDYEKTIYECYVHENGSAVCNVTVYCYGTTRKDVPFEIVSQLGDKEPYPGISIGPNLIIIREMPPMINQDQNCDGSDPWNTCTYTSTKLILYNRGSENASNVILTETGDIGNCSIGNCSSVSYRCVNSSEYSCTTFSDETSHLTFNINGVIKPREYLILEYEFIPAQNKSAYLNSSYKFNSSVLFDFNGTTYTQYEDDEYYNPPESLLMHLRNVSAFNYDLDLDNSSPEENRTFYIHENTIFAVSMISLSGEPETNDSWSAYFYVPNVFNIVNCTPPSPQYGCSFDNINHIVSFNGSVTPANLETANFSFIANTYLDSIYLLPVNKTTDLGYEAYFPGLFTMARFTKIWNVTIPENVTVNVTQPQPEFGPNLIIVREMPPVINQRSSCNSGDPWNTCTYTTNRLVVYNRGIVNATNVTVDDPGNIGYCSTADCSPVAYRCVGSSGYGCSLVSDGNDSHVQFTLNDPIPPGEYRILEYEFVPAQNTSAYTGANISYYFFNATASFKDSTRPDLNETTYVALEDDITYNPQGSKTIELRDVYPFNYDLDTGSDKGKRDFYITENTTFNVSMVSLSGSSSIESESWTAELFLDGSWNLVDCYAPASYGCSIDNVNHRVSFSGSTTPADLDSLDFWFRANTGVEGIFLLPVNKSLSSGIEAYIPGLFTISRPLKIKNITENVTVNVTLPQPSPEFGPNLIMVREMPPVINQRSTCNSGDPWNTCTYTTNRLVVYNRGIVNATNVTVDDPGNIGYCSSADCSPITYRCVSGSDYSCSLISDGNDSHVQFTLNDPIPPREYRILEYEFVPAEDTSAYTGANISYYFFNATASFKDSTRPDLNETTYVALEDDITYNPQGSKTIELRDVYPFNYDLDTGSDKGKRDFYITENTTFNVSMVSLSGSSSIESESWTAELFLDGSWNLVDCYAPASYGCSIDNVNHRVSFSGSTTPADLDSLDFWFRANTGVEGIFLLPVNKSLSSGVEAYIPGLFTISRPLTVKNITEFQNITLPQPQPEFGPNLIFVQEMPPQVNQDNTNCNPLNNWGTCTYTSNRVVVYNRGVESASHVSVEDSGRLGYCSYGSCNPVSYRCVKSPEYICRVCKHPISISDVTTFSSPVTLNNELTIDITLEGDVVDTVSLEVFAPGGVLDCMEAGSVSPSGSDTTYSFSYTPTVSGRYLYRFNITDLLGFSTYPDMYSFTDISGVSEDAPTLSGINILDLIDINRTVVISMNITDPQGDLNNVSIEVFSQGDSSEYILASGVTGSSILSGIFSFFSGLIGISQADEYSYSHAFILESPGGYFFRINAVDNAGNFLSTDAYSFGDECFLTGDEKSRVVFDIIGDIVPRDYMLLEYEFIPVRNESVYSAGGSYYNFNVSIDYHKSNQSIISYSTAGDTTTGALVGVTYLVDEDPLYNPPESKLMGMEDVFAFDYDLDTNILKRRDFFAIGNTSFDLNIVSLSGTASESGDSWSAEVSLPDSWSLGNCTAPGNYLCSVSDVSKKITLSGSTTPPNMQSITFGFTASTNTEDIHLLPISKSLSPGTYEEYIPGLFTVSRPAAFINVTEPEEIPEEIPLEKEEEVEKDVEKEVETEVETEIPEEIEEEVPIEIEFPENVTIPESLELAINIEPVEREITGRQGEFTPVIFNISNIGNVEVTNITLVPMVPPGWEFRTALVSFLNVSESINRTIFVKAPYTVTGTFAIPVKAVVNNFTLDTDYFWITIEEALFRLRLELLEVPKTISITVNSNLSIPILIKNTGKVSLHDITARLENSELCLESFSLQSIKIIEPGELEPSEINIRSKGTPMRCNATLIVGSREDVYTFTGIEIIVTPPPPLIPAITKINLLLVLIIFLAILFASRRSKVSKKKGKNSRRRAKRKTLIRLIFYFILSIIIFILLYLAFTFNLLPEFI
ncbi:MAG: hypothetical protein U9Q22_07820 [Candidatus Altiarchaeota archaeon]|nr:hypothetical protein [Candidatus Altiarchaeota archaeon]